MRKIMLNDIEVRMKYDELLNIHEVAKYFNVSISPIIRILRENSIKLTNRRYNVDKEYFDDVNTEEKAYWLGFLFADGYIRERKYGNSLEMKLSEKDENHLHLFRKHLKSNHKIIKGINKTKCKSGISESRICHLAIYSNELVKSIKNKGMHSKKTFTIDKPNIDKNLINHFIRGYFDGDGSFSFNPKKYINKTQIVSASVNFIDFIINELKENQIEIRLYSNIKLQIQNKIDNLKFYNYIYKNATIFLERKKDKYDEFRKYYKYDN
jgi:intein-encoded DNA endonuclease-like protein